MLMLMGSQTVRSISLGMEEVGKKRLKLYTELARKKGYESLSAYIVDLVDRELGIDLPQPRMRKGPRPKR